MTSIISNIGGVIDTTEAILDGTSATTLLTADENGTQVMSVHVAEVSGNADTVILDRYDVANTTAYNLTGTQAISANDTFTHEVPFVLPKGWVLRARAGTADRLHITTTYLTPPL